MPRRKITYKEGDWIAVPIADCGYALGIITRMGKRGALIGYFFGPLYKHIPKPEDTKNLLAEDAVLICNYGDLGLLNGEWSVIGHSEPWDRGKWPNPAFVRRDSITGKPTKIYYSENDPNCEIAEKPCSEEEARRLPKDGASGYVAVEIKLKKLLSSHATLA